MEFTKTNRYHIPLGLAVSLVITLIGIATVYAIGKPVPYASIFLIGTARMSYAFGLWLLFVPVSRLVKNKLLALFLFIMVGILTIIPLVPFNLWVNTITGFFYPPFEDPAGISDPWENLFWSYVWRGLLISLVIFMIHYREDLVQEKQRYLLANERLKNQNLTHQLELLKQQIDPHFLFNTLNALKTLIRKDPDQAERYAVEISGVYRYLLKHNRNNTVLLKEELDFLYAYLSLLQLRFENNLRVRIDIDPALHGRMLFPLSLQVLVENAVKHNIASMGSPLEVRIYVVDGDWIVVENKLQLRAETDGVSQYGLAHLNKQYGLHFNRAIEITSTSDIFKVSLPLL